MDDDKKYQSYSLDSETVEKLKEIRQHIDKKFYIQNGVKTSMSIAEVVRLTTKYYYDRMKIGGAELKPGEPPMN